MKKRNIIIVCIAVLAVVLSAVGVSMAYLGDLEEKDNEVIVGRDIAEISEVFSEPSEQSMVNEHNKEVRVKNTGSVPCYVRVYAEFSDSEIAKKAQVIGCGSTSYTSWANFKNSLKEPTNTDWVYVEDNTNPNLSGYFYYRNVVDKDKETTPLIENVKVDYREKTDDSNIDRIQDYEIIVYTETVQTTDIDGTEYGVGNLTIESVTVPKENQWKIAWNRFLNKTNS